MRLDVRRLNRVLSYLLSMMRTMSNDNRDFPMEWSIMHMYSSSQLAALIALKKGLNPEIAGLIAALHDIGTVMTKKHKDHAVNAKSYVIDIINKYNNELRKGLDEIRKEELELIIEAIINHSDKANYSENEYVELIKDVDSLDRYLHGIETNGIHMDRLKRSLKILDIQIND